MTGPAHATRWTRCCRPAGYPVVLGCIYAYVFWVIDPRLLLHSQSPAFLLGWSEFRNLLSWPGGLLEYLAAGLCQTYVRPWLGALVITISLGLVWLLSHLLLATVRRSPSVPWLSLVPVVLLLILLNRYTLPLGGILSLVAALFLAWVYAGLVCRIGSGHVRGLIGVGLCAAIYAAAGAAGVLFACLCGLTELLTRRSAAAGTLILLSGAAIPYLAATQVYGISLQEAFLRLTAVEYDSSPPIASIALYGVVPLSVILLAAWPANVVGPRQIGPRTGSVLAGKAPNAPLGCFLRTAALLLAAGSGVWLSSDPHRRAVLAIDYHARHGNCDAVLAAAEPFRWAGSVPGWRMDERLAATCFSFHFPVSAATPAPLLPTWNVAVHDINMSLARKGQLLECMFNYPQPMETSVVRLLPDDKGYYVAHSYNPDILLELGDVNEAERVACESLANIGPRPWLLERLISIHVLKGRPQAARTCLNVMARAPGRRTWSQALQLELDQDPSLSGRQALQQIRSRMYKADHVGHLVHMDPDEQMLRYLLVANPHNRLAFDYLTAHYLVKLRDDKVAENMRYLAEFGYTRLPRHCEESLLLRARLTGAPADVRGFAIRSDTIRRFEAFERELGLLGGPGGPRNLQVRDALVGRYGDTYWFYALFGDTFFRPEQPAAAGPPREAP